MTQTTRVQLNTSQNMAMSGSSSTESGQLENWSIDSIPTALAFLSIRELPTG